MKRTTGLPFAVALILVGLVIVAAAQQPQAADGNIVIRQQVVQGPDGVPPPPDANFVFMASESFGGKIVKGAPYSAEAVTETVQTLADGNRIVNRITSAVFRDSEGRTRREQSLKGLGIFGAGQEPLKMIFINDPVAGVAYSLDSRSHVAHKTVPFRFEFTDKSGTVGVAAGGGEGRRFEFKVGAGTANGESRVIMAAPLPAPAPGEPLPPSEHGNWMMRAEGTASSTLLLRTRTNPQNEVKEQLGKQIIEGVEAEGTRTKVTIPAGEIGNERAIEIVSESWYSPELQLVVMTRHSDPRNGESTYRLTNIIRAEQARYLFEVPGDFTVQEGPAIPKIAPLPRTKKPANPE